MIIKTVSPELPRFKDISKKINECFKRQYVTNDGINLIQFEKNLKKYFKSKLSPVVFCNGELALYTLIQAWKFHLNLDYCKAIVPSFTFSGTVNAIVQNNIKPVFCDVDESLTINLKNVKLDKDIKFIIGASVYGNIPNLVKIKKFAKKNNLVFLLDNAPGFGSRINSKFPHNYSVDEIYSFHATKIFNSIEGGCAITSNKSIHKLLIAARNFGQFEKQTNDIIIPGLNSKMNELSAIVGNYNLKNFNKLIVKRKKVINMYKTFFNKLKNKNLIELMKVDKNVFCNYFFFPIILKKRSVKSFIDFMNRKNIYCRRYYKSVHTLSYYKDKITKKELLQIPFTEKIKNQIVAIPLNTSMNKKEIKYLFKNINFFFK